MTMLIMLQKPKPPFFTRGDAMPSLSNPKHEAFAQAFVRGETAGNRGLSYLAAGYTCDAKSAKEAASRLAKDPRVMRRIAEIKQEMHAMETEATQQATARLAITKEAVLSELAKIAFANMLDYVRPDADGEFDVDLSHIDRDKGAAIQEVVITRMNGAGEGGTPARRIRLKLASKRNALVDLGRHFGLFVERRQGPHAADDYASLSEEQLAAHIRDVVGQFQRLGIDVSSLFEIGDAGPGDPRPARPH
jgi:phage terminase small subunit